MGRERKLCRFEECLSIILITAVVAAGPPSLLRQFSIEAVPRRRLHGVASSCQEKPSFSQATVCSDCSSCDFHPTQNDASFLVTEPGNLAVMSAVCKKMGASQYCR